MLKAISEKVYEGISFSKGNKPRFDLLKSCFIEQGIFINNKGESPIIKPVLDYIEMIDSNINNGNILSIQETEIEQQIEDFAHSAKLAQDAGYDGVEVMGSEGYFLNQFIVTRTNQRDDDWGGSYDNRTRLAIEVVKRVRARIGEKFIIVYRLSMLDLVPEGSILSKLLGLL